MQLAFIVTILVALIGVFFAMQNNIPVTVNFLLWRFDTSLAMVLPLTLASGAIIVALLTTPVTLKRQWLLTRQKRRIEEMEKTTENLRRRIADLETRVPVDEAAEQQSYVGLKQLILGKADDHPQGKGKSE